jgi:hypothetical protein
MRFNDNKQNNKTYLIDKVALGTPVAVGTAEVLIVGVVMTVDGAGLGTAGVDVIVGAGVASKTGCAAIETDEIVSFTGTTDSGTEIGVMEAEVSEGETVPTGRDATGTDALTEGAFFALPTAAASPSLLSTSQESISRSSNTSSRSLPSLLLSLSWCL